MAQARKRQKRAEDPTRELSKRLARAIPDPRCELDHRDPWQLLVATILSAQSTDKTVNRVTRELFSRWPTPAALADASPEAVEAVVKPTGFYRNKAKAIRAAARAVVERHGGAVPRTLAEMVELPGVARKTANLVLGTGYGIASGMVVDTHVSRVAARLALTHEHDPVKIEQDLCATFAKRAWIATAHRLLLHGRYVCVSRAPHCDLCPLNEVCPSREGPPVGRWTDRAAAEKATVASRGAAPLAP
jgi:endonuclease-3